MHRRGVVGLVVLQHLDVLLKVRVVRVVLREDKSDLVVKVTELALERDPLLLHVGDAAQGFSVLDCALRDALVHDAQNLVDARDVGADCQLVPIVAPDSHFQSRMSSDEAAQALDAQLALGC
jgi:hypothetical protein